jgi:U3 small nucleolar RNA-associated protein MPP10
VGLYGEEIDEEEMESYENEGDSQEDKEFEEEEKHLTKKSRKQAKEEQDDEGDELINDQFDHFREIELQNKEEPEPANVEKNDLQKQIERLESKIISKKDWMLQGEVKATQRPVNSLLEQDLQFKTGLRLGQEITPEYN